MKSLIHVNTLLAPIGALEAIVPIINAAQTRATKIKTGEIFRLFAILGPDITLADIQPSKQCND